MPGNRNRFTGSGAAAASALLTAALLAGCAPSAEPVETSSAPAQDAPTPTETTPAPTGTSAPPVQEDVADPSTWQIEDGEIGPLEIGEDFDETLAELSAGDWTNDEACGWTAYWNAPDGAFTVWFARDEQTDPGPIETIAVEWGPDAPTGVGPRTEDGDVGLGSTRDEVRAVYPQAEELSSGMDGRVFLWVSDDDPEDGALFFEYLEGQDAAQSVVLTREDEPPYEVCA
ncbi:hypothetical protein [Microbacterium marinilacus]|uniref:Uncharacterized protein n=1 Tax=Microbacterium marinilacus TaxID=415209 RepID=A0ABP7B1I0_9MICO|nr:hypothetical protein [Microbacterium marinilacus]MBY0690118.1 hypothetical protein [Microbacterium marinilacus]